MGGERKRAGERGYALVAAHCRSLDPDAQTAGERLEALLGRELARRLVGALAAGPRSRRAA